MYHIPVAVVRNLKPLPPQQPRILLLLLLQQHHQRTHSTENNWNHLSHTWCLIFSLLQNIKTIERETDSITFSISLFIWKFFFIHLIIILWLNHCKALQLSNTQSKLRANYVSFYTFQTKSKTKRKLQTNHTVSVNMQTTLWDNLIIFL